MHSVLEKNTRKKFPFLFFPLNRKKNEKEKWKDVQKFKSMPHYH